MVDATAAAGRGAVLSKMARIKGFTQALGD
jgi:hypothetical protein